MREATAVRRRCCPSCRAPVEVRSARWCGSCGTLLAERTHADPDADGPDRVAGGRVRKLLRPAATVLAAGLVLLVGAGLTERVTTASDALADRTVEPPDADVLDRVARRPPAPPPPATADPICTGLRDLACFAWAVPAENLATVVSTGDLLLSTASGRSEVTARSTADGRTVWTSSGAASDHDGNLVTAGDLAIHQESRDRTVGLEVANGEQRWVTSALNGLHLFGATQLPDTVVVVGERGDGDIDDGRDQPSQVLVALDPTSGETLWQLEGRNAGLAPNGVAVVMDDEGHVQALEPGGEVLWELGLGLTGDEGGWINVMGHAVMAFDDDADGRLLRLSDGADLGVVGGYGIAADETHTLLRTTGADAPGEPYLVLIDVDGEVWRTPSGDGDRMCMPSARLAPDTIELEDCLGEQVVLDRASGRERSRSAAVHPSVATRYEEAFVRSFGDHVLVVDHWDVEAAEVLLLDADSGAEVARLPPDTWPVHSHEGDGWHDDLGGVAVLQGRGWLVAVPLPDRATMHTRGPLVRTARGRAGVSAE